MNSIMKQPDASGKFFNPLSILQLCLGLGSLCILYFVKDRSWAYLWATPLFAIIMYLNYQKTTKELQSRQHPDAYKFYLYLQMILGFIFLLVAVAYVIYVFF